MSSKPAWALAQAVSQLRAEVRPVRWVRPQSMHLTLKFLGEIEERLSAGIAEQLAVAASAFAPFSFEVRGLGCFPSAPRARIIWAGIEGRTDTLEALAGAVEVSLKPLGFEPEKRPFSAHVTLGRCRSQVNAEPLRAAIEQHRRSSFGVVDVDCLRLMRSRLEPGGAVYSQLARVELSGEAD